MTAALAISCLLPSFSFPFLHISGTTVNDQPIFMLFSSAKDANNHIEKIGVSGIERFALYNSTLIYISFGKQFDTKGYKLDLAIKSGDEMYLYIDYDSIQTRTGPKATNPYSLMLFPGKIRKVTVFLNESTIQKNKYSIVTKEVIFDDSKKTGK